MAQLTADERRRIFMARQRTSAEMLARPAVPIAACTPLPSRRRLSRIVKTVAIAVLLSAGWFACHAVELNVPASIAEALPRL